MRRPLAAAAFFQAAGIVISYYSDIKIWQLCAICTAAYFVLGRIAAGRSARDACGGLQSSRSVCGNLMPKNVLIFFLIFLVGFSSMKLCSSRTSIYEGLAKDGEVARAEGIVMSVSIRKGSYDIILDCGAENLLVRLRGSEEDSEFVYGLAGRHCRFQGKLSCPDGRRNFGCFDYGLYLRSRNIRRIMNVSRFRVEAGELKLPLLRFLSLRRGRFLSSARKLLDERSFALLCGLMFGEKGYMDEDLYESFKRGGAAHVLAVSGLHVGLVCVVILKLFGGRRNKFTHGAMFFFLLCYVCLSNFSASVMRAALMVSLRIAAFELRRRYDMLSAASLAAIIFMSLNPYRLFDAGFQLSYLAAYSLGVALPWFELKFMKLADERRSLRLRKFGHFAAPGLAVQLGMAPLAVYHFLIFSPAGLILNPAVIAIAGLALFAGLTMFVSEMLGSAFLSAGFSGVARLFCRILIALMKSAEFLGGAISLPAPPLGMLILYYGFFFYFFSERRYLMCRKSQHGRTLALASVIIAASCLLPASLGISDGYLPWSRESRSVVFCDVGQGECMHISSGAFDALVDGGGFRMSNIAENTLRPYLLKNGVSSLDLAIVTHPDSDHALGIRQLSQIMPIKTIAFSCVYEGNEEISEGYRADEIIYLGAGDVLELGAARIVVLGPPRGSPPKEDDNENCIVCMLHIEGVRMLLTADIPMETENLLLDAGVDLRCDLLKVGHHGSAGSTGEEFLAAAGPGSALISCGRGNSYGHPAERVIELLSELGIIVLRVDEHGALAFKGMADGFMIFENASKDAIWHIPATQK
ncbi:MAG: DNA internalization-related competence protein ComEC/Rec2 [Clostridiales bacterium]|nr:DNA internalization-related competence protein ComEC/Rec2 [Clostridiales bacterium]